MEKTYVKRTLVAIPCYNESKTIGSIVLKAKRHVDEVLVVDDGSSDDTAIVAEYAGAVVLKHKQNKGYGNAIQSCFRYAKENKFDVMTIIDGDGQHDPDQIPKIMRAVLEGSTDISIGSRFCNENGKNVPRYRRFGIKILTGITNLGAKKNNKISDGQSGFRSYSNIAIEKLNLKDDDMGISAEILMNARKLGLRFNETEIYCDYTVDGSTKKPVSHGLGVILSILKYMEIEHSLLFFGVPGLILFILGLVIGSYVYLSYVQTSFLSFGPSLITITLLIIGTLLGMTGLILHAVINATRRK